MGMRETCKRCAKACLGFWWLDGAAFCGDCGPEVGAVRQLEVDRKREALASKDHRLRNHGHVAVSRDEVARLGRGGVVTKRQKTARERKAAGLPSKKTA